MSIRRKGWGALLVLSLIVSAVAVVPAIAGKDRALKLQDPEIRAIWVTRWDYRTKEDVQAIIHNCAEYHFNVILFQVRGNGTVFYRSKMEPWAWELTSKGPETTGQHPRWDPLKLACKEAHRNDVELHAYMNVFPAWRSQDYPPPEAGQLWTEKPEWFMIGTDGKKMIPRSNWYSFVSPGIPEVQSYITDVFLEVIKKYKVDGIHFDYIRYPSEIADFSYDPVSLKRFKQETGKAPEEAPEKWQEWRADQVTQIEQAIYRRGKALKPKLIVSASLVADPERGRTHYYQDSRRWLREGTLDMAVSMGYTDDLEQFRKTVDSYAALKQKHWLASGIGVGRAKEKTIQEIEIARDNGSDGVALFAYSSLFPKHEPNERAKELRQGPFQAKAPLPWD